MTHDGLHRHSIKMHLSSDSNDLDRTISAPLSSSEHEVVYIVQLLVQMIDIVDVQ